MQPHREVNDIAISATAEAMKPLIGIDDEGGRFVRVEGAAALQQIARSRQLHHRPGYRRQRIITAEPVEVDRRPRTDSAIRAIG
jgi:hypothetical protein